MSHAPNHPEVSMLRSEIEMLMAERKSLLKIVGAAAVFVSELDSSILPEGSYNAAEILSKRLNEMPEDCLREALEAIGSSGASEDA